MRVFVGIGLDTAMRAALFDAAQRAQQLFPGRYAPADNYHCTLKFIGEAGEREISAIQGAMRAAAGAISAFTMELAQLSFFRRPQDAVLFCGLTSCPPLITLAKTLDQELHKAGFPLELGPYHPHITLARQARIDPEKLSLIPVSPAQSRVEKITLFESCRIANQLRYMPLREYPLGNSQT